jgi:DNA repair protein RecN (Recombination protein N)
MLNQFYLKQTLLQNFATFKNQTIEFTCGLNAIIGETGSGKSLLLDALQLTLGARADKKIVRKNADFALVESTFECGDPEIHQYLEGEGYPVQNNEVVIKRIIFKNGTSKNYINHFSCNLSFLTTFSRKYIDLVGQFENQRLLSESYQLHLLDQYAGNLELVNEYHRELRHYRESLKEYDQVVQSKILCDQRLDYIAFQLQEIDKLNPSSQDELTLLKKKADLQNREKFNRIHQQVKMIIEGDDERPGLLNSVNMLSTLCLKHSDFFLDQTPLIIQIEDYSHELLRSLDGKMSEIDDSDSLEFILDRLDSYQKLKRKFGGSVEDIIRVKADFEIEKQQLDNIELNLIHLKERQEEQKILLDRLATRLHDLRVTTAPQLSQELTLIVRSLKMTGATITIQLHKNDDLSENGFTKLIFLAETNPGEGYFKIREIASGGELSRILLALRQVLSSKDSISIFIFDEIDSGIGGETGILLGKSLKSVAQHGQVMAITHLPQVAQFADHLIVVSKNIQDDEDGPRTESLVKIMAGKKIKSEIRNMTNLNQ